MEFNQKFDRAPILALQDGKSDNIFLLSLSPWLLNLGRHYHVWDLKQQEDYCSVSLQFLETYRLENTETNVEIYQKDNLSHNSNTKGGPRDKAHLH